MDKYDEAIAKLCAASDFQDAVFRAWSQPSVYSFGCLFEYTTPSGRVDVNISKSETCGCLTTVKRRLYPAYTDELTKRIQEDETLPDNPAHITRENIHRFAEWQREMDRTIRNK